MFIVNQKLSLHLFFSIRFGVLGATQPMCSVYGSEKKKGLKNAQLKNVHVVFSSGIHQIQRIYETTYDQWRNKTVNQNAFNESTTCILQNSNFNAEIDFNSSLKIGSVTESFITNFILLVINYIN